MVVGCLIVLAFFMGRYTAGVDNIRPTDACAEVHKAFKDLNTTAGWDIADIRRAQMHLIVDHPECYSPDLVAQAKVGLDNAARPRN